MVLPFYPDARRTALFFDFDGTLVEIAERPDAVALADVTRSALRTIARHAGGAVAIITGRDIATIDDFVSPLRLPIAGVHGFARRDAGGQLQIPEFDEGLLERVKGELGAFSKAHAGLFVESKAGSLALHYRARPELEGLCMETMERVFAGANGFALTLGKMVVEARPEGANKGAAVMAFMSEAPFAGRAPLFAGDDVTDEDAFAAVNEADGISIKVGEGATAAQFRAPTTSTFLNWLVSYAEHLEGAVDLERT